ncbi:hypothetical protein OMP38_14580 [Cohnella ginsengisoli]|uniref:Uncharacterized protein n=1 Tax=Cohnella ginsengisoli TaxID=425004 RepID=A0A9X4QMP7_9BACL|nr:hypothetical protein [Cohnella ginsengisoli]MDG0791943.1 hypothetical protein [Cohnella ginsengisoli]
MIIASSQISKNGSYTAEHLSFEGESFIRMMNGNATVMILDTDEALNLKHLLDTALHGKKYSWQVEGGGGMKQNIRAIQKNIPEHR